MKKIIWICCLFFPQVAGAFFVEEGIMRESQKITIATQGDRAEIRIVTKLVNTGTTEKVFDYMYPIQNGATTPKLYLNATGRAIELLGNEKKLEKIFEGAQKHEDARFFRLHQVNADKLLVSAIILPAGETANIKLKYQIGLDFLDDIFFKEIFLADEILTGSFELALVLDRPQKIKHFLPVYERDGDFLNLEDQIVWRIEAKAFKPAANFKFFFSEVSAPMLTYKTKEGTYFAHFFDVSALPQYDKIQIVIDQSGSVYKKAWQKEQEILSVFLDQLPETKKVKTIFWDDELYELDEAFLPNSRANQKKIIEYFDAEDPLGKSNFSHISTILEETPAEMMTLFLGDFEGLSFSGTQWEDLSHRPIFFLDFAAKNEDLKAWVQAQGGKYLQVFEATEFVKSAEFFSFVDTIKAPSLSEDMAFKFLEEQEFLPQKYRRYHPDSTNFFISRSFGENGKISNNTASFLPKLWGKRKLSSFLGEQRKNGELSDDKKMAIEPIGKFFGIRTSEIFLPEVIERAQNYYKKISELEDEYVVSVEDKIKFDKDKPLYFSEKNGWEQFGFFDVANSKNAIEFAPFSEAQKVLFLLYPDITAPFFGKGAQVNFCYQNLRCLSVLNEARAEARVSDLFFWKGYHLDHWANSYLKTLADKGVLKVDNEGNALPNQKITRGEFVQMAVENKYGKDFERVEKPKILLEDLDENLYLTEVVNFLVEKGIIQGYRDQTFRPHRNLSRAEAVKILLSLQGVTPPEDYVEDGSVFPDVSGWENFWVITAKEKGIVKGYEDGKFRPDQTLTRAESAKLIVESTE